MKIFIAALLAAFCFASQSATAQDFETPGQYNQYINQQHANVISKFLAYNSAVSHGKRAKKVEKLREKLLDEVQESKMNIASMPKMKGDGAFRDSAANFLKLYYNVLNEDYSKIVNMEEIAEQSYDAMEAYLMLQEAVDEKIEAASKRMHTAQQEFATKNNMTLVDTKDEMGEKMEQVGKVNEYYHEIYLLFFRPYLQEQNMMKAVEKGNVGGIEQDRNALSKYATEGLAKLESIKAFNGEGGLKMACKKMLQHYVKEAGDYMKPITEYLLAKERFESIKKDFDKKSEPAQADVDAFNKAVNDFNATLKKYNDANNNIVKLGNENLNEWNNTVNDFFNEQMPR
jgi:hypothetical protein